MLLTSLVQCAPLLWIIHTVLAAALPKVSQTPESTNVISGANITFNCTLTSFENNSDATVHWWRLGGTTFLQSGSNSRIKFIFYKGSSSLELVSARVEDSGVYFCGVRQRGNRMESGTGSRLVVHASPAPLRIVPKIAEENSSALTLICETAEFYPEVLTFTWYEDHMNIVTGINTIMKLNSEGLYEASSCLKAAQTTKSGAVYTCLVSHLTLRSPAMAVYFDSSFKPDSFRNRPIDSCCWLCRTGKGKIRSVQMELKTA
ncbi:immunoglobulin lambda-1 light chain-like isoform X2 [Heptranchias perlo]|uniref:immunoglobulin lambda-1 light chain-like isoform X2 n=1 Tax=Heptranchias perlo TaxID=212740 RepID=UPI00355A18D0